MVHRYRFQGSCFAIDVNSGSVHVLDELTYELLEYLKDPFPEELPKELLLNLNYDLEEVKEAYGELYILFQNGLLFSKEQVPNKSYEWGLKIPIKSACLHVSHNCDLRCKYCFAGTGAFGGERATMSLEVGKLAIDFLLRRSLQQENIEVDFFGGEPLLNFEVVKEVVKYARAQEEKTGKRFRFTLTTNGRGLDSERISYINCEMANVVLSIDGRKEVTDRLRVDANGSGCYDEILPKFKDLVVKRGGKNYYVRGTFTKLNLDFVKDIRHLVKEGFKEISFEPVVLNVRSPYAITKNDLAQIFMEYENLAKEMVWSKQRGDDFNFFHFGIIGKDAPCLSKRIKGCGAGVEYVAVTPEADIYPCHQFVGRKEYVMGNLKDGTFDIGKQAQFAGINISKKSKCKNCWGKLYCGGGCHANNVLLGGDFFEPYDISCELLKKRLECAIWVSAELASR
ncbi:MAG: thioether cross-link-forming SCIFF peptide maturase [Oscillospiraceae bacterium]|nr:thioether cross-link-forming SCIFF peptide maturase [Oscillospiraceae bacterium]